MGKGGERKRDGRKKEGGRVRVKEEGGLAPIDEKKVLSA